MRGDSGGVITPQKKLFVAFPPFAGVLRHVIRFMDSGKRLWLAWIMAD